MALFQLLTDLSGLTAEVRETRLVFLRIAEALERLSPPIPASEPSASELSTSTADTSSSLPYEFSLSESPEEYRARTDEEAALAVQLGFAPWSPQFQALLAEMRGDLMKPRMVTDDEGNQQEVKLTKAEADQAIQDAFREAAAEANVRQPTSIR